MPETPEQRAEVIHHHHSPIVPTKTSGTAIASLVLGILSCLGAAILFFPPLIGTILGHLSLGAIKRDPNLDGKGLAIAGVILGWLSLAGWIILFLFFGGLAIIGIGASATGAGTAP